MKPVISSVFILLLSIGITNAQTTPPGSDAKPQHKAVYEQLNLTADQKSKLQALREEHKRQLSELRTNNQLSAAEKQERKKLLHRQFRSKSQEVLTPSQRQQLAKIRKESRSKSKEGNDGWRKEGSKGKNLHQQLNLSAEQQQQIAKVRAEFKNKLTSIRNDNSITHDQKRTKLHDIRKQQREQMKSFLTSDQIEKLKELRQQRS